jgi:hypothetical protein
MPPRTLGLDVRLEIDDREVRRMLEAGDKVYVGAASWSLNRAWQMLRTRWVRLLARRLGIKQQYIRRRVRLYRASFAKLAAEFQAFIQPLNPARFGATWNRGPGGGVAWYGRDWPGAFIARGMGHGRPMVFRRPGYPGPTPDKKAPRKWGESQTPIEPLKVDISDTAGTALNVLANRHASDFVQRIFPRELIRRLNRASRR